MYKNQAGAACMVARAGFRFAPGFDDSASLYGSVRLTRALRQRRLVLPPAGHFSPRKSAENAPGAAAPGLPWGCAACIPGRGIAQTVAVHRAIPSAATYPFKASRGPVESQDRYGYTTFLKGRTGCLGQRQDTAHGSTSRRRPYSGRDSRQCWMVPFAVGARIARPLASRVQGSPMTAAG